MSRGILSSLVVVALIGSLWWVQAPEAEAESKQPENTPAIEVDRPSEAPVHATRPASYVAAREVEPEVPDASTRGPGEWRGMRVDMQHRSQCASTEHCSASTACWEDGQCGPCRADAECLGHEICVLEHCVASEAAACRSVRDCPDDGLCGLVRTEQPSPRPGGPALASTCGARAGGVSDEQAVPAREAPDEGAPRSVGVRPEDLLKVVRAGTTHEPP